MSERMEARRRGCLFLIGLIALEVAAAIGLWYIL